MIMKMLIMITEDKRSYADVLASVISIAPSEVDYFEIICISYTFPVP